MNSASPYRLILLYPHLVSCCIAIGCIFLFDIKMVLNKFKLDKSISYLLDDISKIVSVCLVILWITGLGLILFDSGHFPSFTEIMAKPKLFTKLIVVSILTINGYFLHKLVINKSKNNLKKFVYTIGAISGGSWFYAMFLGIAKPLNNVWSLSDFLGVYIILIAIMIMGVNLIVFTLRMISMLKIIRLEQLVRRHYIDYSKLKNIAELD
ncbi:MAG: hypothetical protein RLZZ210_1485 [Pseudomonadota bacterium]|jgi:hypothetical protein